MDDDYKQLLKEVSKQLGSVKDIRTDIQGVKEDVGMLRDKMATITILTTEEVQFIRTSMQAKIAERDFWREQKSKIVGAGLLAAISIMFAALWHYVASLFSNGGGS